MFWKKKKKVNISNATSTLIIGSDYHYVDIRRKAKYLAYLNDLANSIEQLNVECCEHASSVVSYQTHVREAFILEFEKGYQELFCQPLRYDDYEKTRSLR